MTLDETIKREIEVAEKIHKEADVQKGLNHGYYLWRSEHAKEHEQLAEWLEELKELREFKAIYQKGMDYSYATFMYNKAIDDFAEKISKYGTYDDYGNVVHVLEIAEKLKKECVE